MNHKKNTKAKTKHKLLKILNVNFQSTRAKASSFLLLLETEDPDTVVGTESWLHDGIASGEIFPPQYQVFRRDRESDPHGGVFLAIKNVLIASEEKDLSTQTESIWASVHVKGVSLQFLLELSIGLKRLMRTTSDNLILLLAKFLSKLRYG